MGDVGLTAFIIAMIRADRAALARASTDKLAAKYEIPPQTAAFYLNAWSQAA